MSLFKKLTHIGNRSKLDSLFKSEKVTHDFCGDHKNKPLALNINLVNSKMNKAKTNKSIFQHEVCDIEESTVDIFDQLHKNREFNNFKGLVTS